jgi:hypothetical protein
MSQSSFVLLEFDLKSNAISKGKGCGTRYISRPEAVIE